ncbi:MAG: DUF393 domain-containing protein [Elusimicrobia bacterium]|nr:DUF393 domain-containing protein [Elusimicrobiota bacterium]
MTEEIKTPIMLYDGDCAFCRGWVEKWRGATGGAVRYEPYQLAGRDYPQVTAAQCAEAVQLILPGGAVFSGAYAVFKALALGGKRSWPLWFYEKAPLFGPAAEWFYRLVARHRTFFSKF